MGEHGFRWHGPLLPLGSRGKVGLARPIVRDIVGNEDLLCILVLQLGTVLVGEGPKASTP